VVLDKDLPSPFAPESDEEKAKAKDEPAEKDKAKEEKPKDAKPTKIDLEGIGQRILALPLPAHDYVGLQAGKAGVLFLAERSTAPMPPPGPNFVPPGFLVQKFDMTTRKTEKVLDGVSGFEVSANGDKVLYRQNDKWFITAANAPIKPGEGALKTDDLEVYIDPRAEWKQMYHEAWRLQRFFLYDPHYHGYDINAAEKQY